ncbi:hypothetical protein F5Y07DRAFT_310795 [Xylaria sp. FL0933]|nr:hypothetical protein F5Y07DRAFT_310795 [Xylaria sp. FL0933]
MPFLPPSSYSLYIFCLFFLCRPYLSDEARKQDETHMGRKNITITMWRRIKRETLLYNSAGRGSLTLCCRADPVTGRSVPDTAPRSSSQATRSTYYNHTMQSGTAVR